MTGTAVLTTDRARCPAAAVDARRTPRTAKGIAGHGDAVRTHDQTEALALADRIAVIRDARLVDIDTAERESGTRSTPVPPSAGRTTVGVAVVAPATVVAAALAGSWTGPLPSDLGLTNFRRALSGQESASLSVSLQTALLAGGFALVLGTWEAPGWWRKSTDVVFHLPVAVPSVAIGLGVLIAFNERPLLLGGSKWIVIVAHSVLVLAYAFSTVTAALDRLDPAYRQVAESLGAGSIRVLVQVTLPLLLPALSAAAGLAIALSMGELGATIMVYRQPGRPCRSPSSASPTAAKYSTPPQAPACSYWSPW